MKFVSLLIVSAALCACNLSHRLNIDAIVTDAERIRDAQPKFRAENGRYGTLAELASQGLIGDHLTDGRDAGFILELNASGDKYSLSIYPDASTDIINKDDNDQVSLYCDEKGILRGSLDRNKRADAGSSEIRPKH